MATLSHNVNLSTAHAPGLTRRVALTLAAGTAAASAATALAATKALGAAGSDPIFAAIERHRTLVEAESRAVLAADKLDQPLNQAELDAAVETAVEVTNDAAYDLLDIEPTSLAGVLALMRYAAEHIDTGSRWPEVEPDEGNLTGTWESCLFAHTADALEKLAVAS